MHAQIIQAITYITESGIEPTESAISGQCGQDVSRELRRMLRAGLVDLLPGDLWCVTTGGHLYHEDALSNPYEAQPHYHMWIDAVQTGMNPDGSQSHITNPAVPRCARPGFNDVENTFLSHMRDRRRLKKIKKRYPKGDSGKDRR